MNLYLDLDGCITRYPEFFSKLSCSWNNFNINSKVYIITFRRFRESCITDCKTYGIHYDEIFLAANEDDKARIIKEYGEGVFFDDDPDFIVHCGKEIPCFLVRNEDNFDYEKKQFLFTKYTGRVQIQAEERELLKRLYQNLNRPAAHRIWNDFSALEQHKTKQLLQNLIPQ